MNHSIIFFALTLIVASSGTNEISSSKEFTSPQPGRNNRSELKTISNKFKDKAEAMHSAEEKQFPVHELRTCLGARAMKDLIDGHPASFCLHIYRTKGWLKENE